MTRFEIICICGFYIFFMFMIGGFAWRFVKDRTVILTILKIDWEDLKEWKFHKLEEDQAFII